MTEICPEHGLRMLRQYTGEEKISRDSFGRHNFKLDYYEYVCPDERHQTRYQPREFP